MSHWQPLTCSLQLHFGASPTIRVGDTYGGLSVIRYIRQSRGTKAATGTTTTTAPQQQHQHATEGLPFHAVTKPVAGQALRPLTVKEYRLTRLHPSTTLKVSSVVALDEDAQAQGNSTGKTQTRNKEKKSTKASTGGGNGEAPAVAAEAAPDIGSKLVLFDGSGDAAAAFPDGAEVELTIAFTGHVQGSDHGAIYLAAPRGGGMAPLLTHFEVSLARWAFPCPDDPHIRVDWTLQSLQLPARYGGGTVITNGSEVSRRVVRGQGGDQVQLSFSPVGPLPAYVFAFAAYPDDEPLLSVTGELSIASATAFADPPEEPLPETERRALPVAVLTQAGGGGGGAITTETLHTVLDALLFSVTYFTDFFHCPLPLCGCDKLQLLLAPTMPYISGMEHHGCIFLNESIFTSGGAKPSDISARIELIVHEVAHHWVGNRVGFSFAVKEGICQVLEQQGADAFLGRPPRKLVALSGGGERQEAAARPSVSGKNTKKNDKAGSTATTATAATLITETVKGKEFTGHSYQQALAEVQNRIVEKGLPTFQARMRSVMQQHVVAVTREEEEAHGGREAMRLAGVQPQQPAYFSTEDFIALMSSS